MTASTIIHPPSSKKHISAMNITDPSLHLHINEQTDVTHFPTLHVTYPRSLKSLHSSPPSPSPQMNMRQPRRRRRSQPGILPSPHIHNAQSAQCGSHATRILSQEISINPPSRCPVASYHLPTVQWWAWYVRSIGSVTSYFGGFAYVCTIDNM